jgi:signal transduction histidine kinase
VSTKKDISIKEIQKQLVARKSISVGSLIRTSIRVYKPLAKEKRQKIALYLPKDKTPLETNPLFFIEVFENILHKVLVHGDEGMLVTVSLHKESDVYTVSVHGKSIRILPQENLTNEHGGKIWSVSSPRGVTFYFTVPSTSS